MSNREKGAYFTLPKRVNRRCKNSENLRNIVDVKLVDDNIKMFILSTRGRDREICVG